MTLAAEPEYTRRRGPLAVLLVRRCRDQGAALRLEHAIKRLFSGRERRHDRMEVQV